MADTDTDGNGVPIDEPVDHEGNDPSSDDQAPDALLGESQRGTQGALSNPALIGSKNDARQRAAQERGGMDDLRAQYGDTQNQLSGAYNAQLQNLRDATQRILQTQIAPSVQENRLRLAAAIGTPNNAGNFNAPGIANAQADILQGQRQAELQKQQLMAQYGSQIPASMISALNARSNALTQQMRIQAGLVRAEDSNASKPDKISNKYYTTDPNTGQQVFNQALYDNDIAADKQKKQDAASAKVWAQQASVGVIAPEVVKYVQQNLAVPPGFSRNPMVVAKAFQMAHDANVAAGIPVDDAFMNAMSNKAIVPALGALTKQQAMVSSFEKNAEKNAEMALQLSRGVDRTGSPWANEWVQAAQRKITGSTPLAQFSAANDTFLSEYAKIMGSANAQGSGATSDTAMAHARAMLNTAMSNGTYAGVIATLRQEMNNRLSSMEETRQGYLRQLSGTVQAGASAPGAPAAPPAGAATPHPDPMVAYYLAVAKARAAGQPPPPMPQGLKPPGSP